MKPRLATASLAGCFGCHMSLLDIDERILQLAERVDFDRSPINDLKKFAGHCRIGLVEGGVANEENVKVLKSFRENCDILVVMGECAIMGGIPALRNGLPLSECLEEAYRRGPTVYNPTGQLPNDPALPLLLDRVYPCRDIVKVDLSIPGCPPPAEALWTALTALLEGREAHLPAGQLRYD